jgi:hypothetical protein
MKSSTLNLFWIWVDFLRRNSSWIWGYERADPWLSIGGWSLIVHRVWACVSKFQFQFTISRGRYQEQYLVSLLGPPHLPPRSHPLLLLKLGDGHLTRFKLIPSPMNDSHFRLPLIRVNNGQQFLLMLLSLRHHLFCVLSFRSLNSFFVRFGDGFQVFHLTLLGFESGLEVLDSSGQVFDGVLLRHGGLGMTGWNLGCRFIDLVESQNSRQNGVNHGSLQSPISPSLGQPAQAYYPA